MFEDVYKEFPENLRRQSEQLAEEIKLNAELGLAETEERKGRLVRWRR